MPIERARLLLLSYALFGTDEYGLLTFGLFFYPIYVIHLRLPPTAHYTARKHHNDDPPARPWHFMPLRSPTPPPLTNSRVHHLRIR